MSADSSFWNFPYTSQRMPLLARDVVSTSYYMRFHPVANVSLPGALHQRDHSSSSKVFRPSFVSAIKHIHA